MKKIVSLLLIVFSTHITINAQEYKRPDPIHKKGQISLFLGTGFLSADLFNSQMFQLQNPITSLDYAVSTRMSLGVYYTSNEEAFNSSVFPYEGGPLPVTINNHYAGIRILGHFSNFEKVDCYGGLSLGYNFGNVRLPMEDPELYETLEQEYLNPVHYTGVFGLRYYLNDNLSVNGELQLNTQSLGTLGFGFRF